MSDRAGGNPFALARAARIRIRAKLLKAELKARHDAAPDEYLRANVVVPAATLQVSDPGLFNDILGRMMRPRGALPVDELDKAARQFRELLGLYGVPIERAFEENSRKLEEKNRELEDNHRKLEENLCNLEDSRRKIEDTNAARSKGGKISGEKRAQKTAELDAAVSKVLPTLPARYRKQPQSAGAIEAIRDNLPAEINYKDSAIRKSVGRVRGVRTRTKPKVSN